MKLHTKLSAVILPQGVLVGGVVVGGGGEDKFFPPKLIISHSIIRWYYTHRDNGRREI